MWRFLRILGSRGGAEACRRYPINICCPLSAPGRSNCFISFPLFQNSEQLLQTNSGAVARMSGGSLIPSPNQQALSPQPSREHQEQEPELGGAHAASMHRVWNYRVSWIPRRKVRVTVTIWPSLDRRQGRNKRYSLHRVCSVCTPVCAVVAAAASNAVIYVHMSQLGRSSYLAEFSLRCLLTYTCVLLLSITWYLFILFSSRTKTQLMTSGQGSR